MRWKKMPEIYNEVGGDAVVRKCPDGPLGLDSSRTDSRLVRVEKGEGRSERGR